MQTQVAPQLNVAKTLLSNLAAELVAGIDAAGTPSQQLSAAEAVESELAEAASAIELAFGAAKLIVATRTAELRAEVDAAAMARVVSLLDAGTISLADLAARMTNAPQAAAVVTLHAVAAPAAPAPVVVVPAMTPAAAVVAKVDPALPAEIRENLRLQNGYLNAVKYRDPATGAGWSGRGPMPKWLKALLVDGKTLADFLAAAPVAAPVAAAPVADEPAAAAAPVAAVEAAEVVAGAAQEDGVAQGADESFDIGDDLGSFDASGMAGDLNTAPGGLDDDIGEIVHGIASMPLAPSQATFMAAA